MKKETKKIKVGNVYIGGGAPVTVQSMTNTDTKDVRATLSQIFDLYSAGCDIVRLAVLNEECAKAVYEIKKESPIPIVCDIHFDHRLALSCIENGADKIRINPGNIGKRENVAEVVKAAKERNIPIRIGVNGGSLEKDILKKYGKATPEAICESAFRHIEILEDLGFTDICVSLKASDVKTTVMAYRLFSNKSSYPLHLGVTEAGTSFEGLIKSACGIGSLLLDGIGDTIRFSLTADPVEEVRAGVELLKALMLREGPILTSCPTCGRCQVDLIPIASEVSRRLSHIKKNIHVAVMGCAVNGPGEAKEADIGIAGGRDSFVLFKKGKVVGTIPQDNAADRLYEEILRLEEEEG